MSNTSTFDLVISGADLGELRAAYDLLRSAPCEWEFLPIERDLTDDGGYRFRARAWSDEDSAGKVVSGENGILADIRQIFVGLTLVGRFRDEIGFGTLTGVEKEYEQRFDEEEEGEPLDPPDAPLLIWSETPLEADAAPFGTRLEGIGNLLLRALNAVDVGCTLVDEGTTVWTVSATVPELEFEQVRELCRELRRLRVPLDTRLERGERMLPVWPISQRPWRRIL